MRKSTLWLLIGFVFAFALVGCTKKTTQEASISGTGFDSLATTDELSQLPPPSNTAQMSQTPVEALPIEAAPVTQAVPVAQTMAPMAPAVDVSGLSHEQKIQTALKNAGFYMGAIDGKIGPASKKAIEAFQQSQGLKVDGKVGPKTWAALDPYLNGSSAVAVPAGDSVAQ